MKDSELRDIETRARAGGARSTTRRTPRRASSSRASASSSCSTRARSSRTACSRTASPRLAGRRRRHRHRPRAGPGGRGHGQRLHREGRLVGRAHGREDPPHPGDGARPALPALLPGRLRRRAHHRSDRDVPRAAAAPGASSTTRSQLSGQVPQICLLFGPSAAGGAYIPAFCDVVVMVDGNASMYLGSPRMAEMVIGEKVTLEEMGGAKMHCSRLRLRRRAREDRGGGHRLRASATSRYLPQNCDASRRRAPKPRAPKPSGKPLEEIIPADENKPFDMMRRHRRAHRRGLLACEIKQLFAQGDHHRLRAHRRARRRHRRQPAEVHGRRALRRLGRQGRALHLAVRRVQHPAPLPRRRARLHDRHQGRAAGHHPRRREDDRRRERGDRAQAQRRRAQGLRRRALRDVRPGVRARRVHRAAHGVDRRHGPAGGGQRRLLQQDPGGPGGPERDAYVEQAARRVPSRHRPREARQRARDRRRHPLRALRSEVAARLQLASGKPRPERRGPWLAPM